MKKILIIDDSMMITKAISIILTKEGFKCIEANDGAKGLELAEKEMPNLIILDLMMPGMNGEDVFQALKSNEKTKGIKTIVLTARADALRWSDKLEGCELFMTKPFDNNELSDAVKKLIDE